MSSKHGQQLNWIQHALQRPDVYIGSIKNTIDTKWIATESGKMKRLKRKWNEGFERIHIEQLCNAVDNKWRSDEEGTVMTCIKITFDEKSGEASIYNDGKWIPIEQHDFKYTDPDTNKTVSKLMYPSQLYFGEWLSSTNYDDTEKRKTAGRNGMGAKATNIFSTEFIVETVDPTNGKKYICIYKENRSMVGKPRITKSSAKRGYTKITWKPDFEKFGLKKYEKDYINLFRKHAYDMAMVTGIPVWFNGKKISITNLKNYAKLFLPDKSNMMSFNTNECEVVLAEQSQNVADQEGFNHISFVNGIYTKDGGVHVEAWRQALLAPIRDNVNKTKKTESGFKVTLKDVEAYFIIFIRCELDKPTFNSQTKHGLRSPKPNTIKPTSSQLTSLMKWTFVYYLTEKLKYKERLKVKKTDGSSRSVVGLGSKLDDANWASTRRSDQCELYLTEGHSAAAFVRSGRNSVKDGNNTMGIYCLRGKPLNAMRCSVVKLNANEEISGLKRALGLRYGVDYSLNTEKKTLRYGGIVLICDQDVDGYHIAGLVTAFFYKEYRKLVESGFIRVMNTPIVKVFIKKNPLEFYTQLQYQNWYIENKNKVSKTAITRYYKGLATSTKNDAKNAFSDPKISKLITDGDENEVMQLGFSESRTDDRKKWLNNAAKELAEIDNNLSVEDIEEKLCDDMTLSTYVDERLRLYHLDNLRRSLPNVIDGLKQSQRKILYGCFLKGLTGDKSSVKVEQLSGYISENTGYHHGEASLHGAIIKMAQGYVGSNNIPLLFNDGQFGTRIGVATATNGGKNMKFEGGADHGAPRYIFTRLEKITRLLFRAEDDVLLDRVDDDGKIVEPTYFVPILPFILVNGACGIASGYSTDIPSYNPLDLIKWIKAYLNNKERPFLVPWWRNFNGKVKEEKDGVMTEGIITHTSGRMWEISELPIGFWTRKFIVWLENLMRDGKIKRYADYGDTNTVRIEIEVNEAYIPSMDEDFKILRKKCRTTNMVALDRDRKGHVYATPHDILEEFCKIRYDLYTRRKESLLKQYNEELKRDENRYRFITEVIDDRSLIIFNKEKIEICGELEDREYYEVDRSFKYLLDMPFSSLSRSRLEKLKNNIKRLGEKIRDLKKKTEKDLWLADLDEFVVEYKKFLKYRED